VHKTHRRGAAVFNNSQNKLQLVDVVVLASHEADGFRFDERSAQEKGLARLAEARPGEHWDYVGTLFASTGGLDRGLINWGEDFARVEVIA
jgi:hypothetical protein